MDNNIIDVKENKEKADLENGNYIIEILDNNKIIKKILISNAAINIKKIENRSLIVELPS